MEAFIKRSPVPKRNFAFDNLRLLLIALVVLGHLLELYSPPGNSLLYRVIYSFHMPAFIFLTGYFAKFDPIRILSGYLVPYALFQFLYIKFSEALFHIESPDQFTTPHWLLWYLLACAFYLLLIPFFDAKKPWQQIAVLAAVIVLSLLVGYDETVGYYGSLSRFFVFLPWFLLGFYCRKNETALSAISNKIKLPLALLAAAIAVGSVFYLRTLKLPVEIFYGSYPYAPLQQSFLSRLLNLLIAGGWLGALCFLFRRLLNFRIPLLTSIGQNTLPIYLLHGFVIKALPFYLPDYIHRPWFVAAATCGMLLLFGNALVGRLFRFLFSDLWRILRKSS